MQQIAFSASPQGVQWPERWSSLAVYCLIVKLYSLFMNRSHTQNLMILNNKDSKGITCVLLESQVVEDVLSVFIQLF